MQVIGQGNVQLHQASLSSNNARGTKKITATIPIVVSSVPRVKVLAVVAREDGELVADVIELPVSCELEHEVRERGRGERVGCRESREVRERVGYRGRLYKREAREREGEFQRKKEGWGGEGGLQRKVIQKGGGKRGGGL